MGNDLSEIGLDHYKGRDLRIISGHAAISQHIAETVQKRGMLAYRDYYPWWGKVNNEAAHAGKPIYVDTNDMTVHPIFFDDHIGTTDPHIVDLRTTAGEPLPFNQA